MKQEVTLGSLRQFIDVEGKDTDIISRKQYMSSIDMGSDDEKTCIVTISTKDMDRQNDIVMPQGCNTDEYAKNSIVLIDHDWKTQNIVGKSIELQKTNNGMVAKVKFADTQLANDIWSLVKGGFLKATSIGFRADEVLTKGTKEFIKNCKDMAMIVPEECLSIISKSTLLEFSFVAIPANNNALVQAISSKSLTIQADTLKRFDLKQVKEEVSTVIEPKVESIIEVKPVVEPVIEVKPIIEAVKPIPEPIPEPIVVTEPKEEPLKIEYIEVIREGALDVVNEAKSILNVSKGKLV